MADMYFTEAGDIRVSPNGDIALTETPFRQIGQQAHIRVMTATGDFVIYPKLGANLYKLYGMPQSEATGEYGKALIKEALEREGAFAGKTLRIQAIPTGPQSIRFDIYITTTSATNLVLSIEKNLTIQE